VSLSWTVLEKCTLLQYEDMYIKSILAMMLCYYCVVVMYFVVTVCEHSVILQQIVKYTYINKRVSLIWD
jgi:hypothetical protein